MKFVALLHALHATVFNFMNYVKWTLFRANDTCDKHWFSMCYADRLLEEMMILKPKVTIPDSKDEWTPRLIRHWYMVPKINSNLTFSSEKCCPYTMTHDSRSIFSHLHPWMRLWNELCYTESFLWKDIANHYNYYKQEFNFQIWSVKTGRD